MQNVQVKYLTYNFDRNKLMNRISININFSSKTHDCEINIHIYISMRELKRKFFE